MDTELNIGPHHHKPKNIRQMLMALPRNTTKEKIYFIIEISLYQQHILAGSRASKQTLTGPHRQETWTMREICVRRRRPLRRQFVGFGKRIH